MMLNKIIPIVGTGFTKEFFSISISDGDMSLQPHLQLPYATNAQFAIEIGDDGLSILGVTEGDFVLFTTTSLLKATGQIVLVRQDEEYIIREAHWDGDFTLLRVPNDEYEPMKLPTENIRIVAVLDNVIKNHDEIKIIHFD